MLILPYSTALRLDRIPYVTFSIILLCVAIFMLQLINRTDINKAVSQYCYSIKNTEESVSKYDQMTFDSTYCNLTLRVMHNQYDINDWQNFYLEHYKSDETKKSLKNHIEFDLQHYNEFLYRGAPKNLDVALMYYPYTFNPIKMLTATLSHADWPHLIFNLIFFFAFTPALEIIVASKLKFISIIVAIEIIGSVLYSLASIYDGSDIPTLGLSGAVTGMIGFSAYMMPKARVRTIFWFLFYIRRLFIPVWVLAIWFIGWDMYDLFSRTDNGGVNLLAHVSGGVSGYIIARIWFKSRREDIQEELDDEIENARARREDSGSRMSSSMADQRRIQSEYRESQASKSWQVYKDKLHKFVQTGNSSEAVILLLQDYEFNAKSPETFEELFKDIGDWSKKRSYFCAGRLLINLYLEMNKIGAAFQIINLCIKEDKQFLLPDYSKVLMLAKEATNHKRYVLAYYLINNYKIRYSISYSCVEHVMLEASLLFQYLDKKSNAVKLLEKEIAKADNQEVKKLGLLLEAING
ncbi:hypothetical protein MNBD_GAMMA22-2173 [hydrothermal vent metagenome]|uniref:Peptidase S54 rhomboid domain-containing protein n=1 Tax=hydrothermal vent metagenome TaxID=652676 RepID=A0A3B0ZR57_9ZZZZ